MKHSHRIDLNNNTGALVKLVRSVSVRYALGILFALTPLIIVLSASNAWSQDVNLSQEEREWLTAHPKLTVDSYTDQAPFGFVSEGGRYMGIIPDICARLEKILGITIELRGLDYPELLDCVKNGSADITSLNDPQDMPYQEHYIKSEDFLFLPYSLFVRKDSELAREKPKELTGKTIALCRGWDLSNPSLEILKGNRFIFGESMLDCVNLVVQGQADGIYDVHSEISYILRRHSIQELQMLRMYREGYSAAFFIRKDWPLLQSAFNKAIAQIPKGEMIDFLKKWNAYLDDDSYRIAAATFSITERQWLREHPVVQVGVDPGWSPVEFVDTEGHHQGITADYLKLMEGILGIQLKRTTGFTWKEIFQQIKNREIDMVSCVEKTPERLDKFDFTTPYLSLPVVVITRDDTPYVSDLKVLAGRNIGIVNGYAVQEWLARDYPELKLVYGDSTDAILDLLTKGQVDACVDAMLPASHAIAKSQYVHLRISGETSYRYELRMATHKDNPVLIGLLQKALDTIPESQRAEILERWAPIRLARWVDYTILWKTLAVVFVVIVFILYWNRRLSRLVVERTADLHREYESKRVIDRQFQAVFNQSFQFIGILSPEGKVLAANQTALAFKGITEKDVLHKIFWETPWCEGAPEFQSKLRERIATALGDEFVRYETTRLNVDGNLRTLDLSLKPIKDESGKIVSLLVEGRDITERKQAEEASRRSEQQFRMFFDMCPFSCVVNDREGRYVLVNKAFSSFTGYSAEEALGRTANELGMVHENNLSEVLAELATKGKIENLEMTVMLKSGEKRHILFSSQILDYQSLHVLTVTVDITERKLIDVALRESEERFRFLYERNPAPMLVYERNSLRMLSVNEAFMQHYGYSQNEALALCLPDLYPDEEKGPIIDLAARLHGHAYVGEWHHIKHDGTMMTIVARSHDIMFDGRESRVAVVTDITDRKRAEEALQASEGRLRMILDSVQTGIVILEPETNRITDVNPVAAKIIGLPREAIVGSEYRRFFYMAENSSAPIAQPSLDVNCSEGILRTASGEERTIIKTAGVSVELGGHNQFIENFLDITERKRAEAEAHLRQQQLIQADKMVSLGTLVAGVAHEINNPNTFITLNASIFREVWTGVSPFLDEIRATRGDFPVGHVSYDVIRDYVPELVRGMEQGAFRIKKIVSSLKDFARQDVSGMDEEVDLNEVVNAAETLMHNRLKTATNRFEVQTAPELPRVKGNFQRIEQVLINLLSNACDALPDHEKTIVVSTSVDPVRRRVLLTVMDEGSGIPDDVLAWICDPFFTTKRDSGGTGLGLSISHGIIQEHGGTISFSSTLGKGTTVTVEFPMLSRMEPEG